MPKTLDVQEETIVSQYRQILTETTNRILKPIGFKNSRNKWNRVTNEIIQVFHMQLDRLAFADYVRVTFNIGFCSLAVWKLVWDKPLPKYLDETDCCPRTRIGYLISGEKHRFVDKWWSLESPDESLFVEIGNVISGKCVPFFERTQSLADLHTMGETLFRGYNIGEQIQHAVLCYLLGDRNRCQMILDACQVRILRFENEYFGQVLSDVRDRLRNYTSAC
jgi:hypothetical protein